MRSPAEKLDRVFRSASQVEKATGVAVLGMVPLVKGSAGLRANIVTQVLDRTTSSAAEAMRAVFTAISLSNLDRPARVIAVTSSTPAEGKTTFAAALGGLLTKMNASRRVLLVDLDLRQAKLAVALGLKDRGGTIDEYLMGTKTLDECIRRHDVSGVDYICARADTPNAPEILESHAMKAALATFADRYDLVILDSPPVMAVSDARIIAQLADYTIFIVHWAKTPRDVVKTRRLRPAGRHRPRRHRHQQGQSRQARAATNTATTATTTRATTLWRYYGQRGNRAAPAAASARPPPSHRLPRNGRA